MKLTKSKTIVIIFVGILFVLSFYFCYNMNKKYNLADKTVYVNIKEGDGFGIVANQLVSNGVVNSKLSLKLLARIKGIDKKLTPGRYEFIGENNCFSILERLEKADFVRIKITIPEGMAIWKTASLLHEKMNFDSAQLIALNTDYNFLRSRNISSLEGYLYPETYFFPWGSSLSEVVDEMVNRFHAVTESIWIDDVPNGLTKEKIVILASIIEAETSLEDEHRLVSSVYHNRLTQNMKLDADPTVIYGLGGLNRPLWKKDLQQDTPYNTYLHKGLPPTPINSPSLTSIKAALDPEETEYLFFVADRAGGHYFSKTNAEHNQARKRIKTEN